MFDLYALASEYLANKEQASILVHRIEKIQKGNDFLLDSPEAALTEDEKKILSVVGGWKKRLFNLGLSICRYELAVAALDSREQMVLHLHFENGVSLSQISKMDLRKYSVGKISISTLNRIRQTLVNKFQEQTIVKSLSP